MDKNMIHIDDLVKQRLNGGEEQERPGAWLHMKELLDEKMPTRVPVAFGWRRMMTFAAAALALSAIGVGGYKAISSMHTTADKTVASAATPTANTAANNSNPNNPVPKSNTANNGTANIITSNDKDKISSNNLNTNNNTPAKNNKKNIVKSATDKAVTVAPAPEKATASIHGNSTKHNIDNKLTDNNLKSINSSVAANKVSANTTANASKSVANTATTITPASGNTGNHNKIAGVNKPGHNKIVPASGNTVANNTSAVAKKNSTPDSIASVSVKQKMTIDHRSNAAHYSQEVTSVGKTPAPVTAERPANSIPTAENNYNNPRYVANATSSQNNQVAANPTILPAAAQANATTANNNNNIGLASTHKARKSSGWNFDAVNQFFKDVKYNLGQVTYSTGLTGGFNALFLSGKVLPGIQLGLTETFGISDRVSIMTELKYIQSFNKGMVVSDDYTLYKHDGNEWTKESRTHYYKFSTLQNVSLPVSVHYKMGNVSILGGVSFSYILGVNAEPTDDLVPGTHSTVAAPSQEEIDRVNYKIGHDDFNSSFGIGYLLGVSYDVAPRLSVDMRMTQSFWNSANTPGAKLVSDRLYKKPGVQLSVGYNLSKGKKH